jgi:hypothetical protein
MSKAISVHDDLIDQYEPIATGAHIPWEHLFHEALEYALPEMQKRYAVCSQCKQQPRKGATFCDNCGTKLAKQE